MLRPNLTVLRTALLSAALFATGCPGGSVEPPEVTVHEKNLVGARGKNFTYVRGDVIDCKNTGIDYLEGNK